jgi:type IV pilus assembly protein PilE
MRRTQGFTLIELMITVVIIAVIAAIAVPNYTDYITRSKFAEAHSQLADLRVKMEQYYMDNRRYSTAAGTGATTCPVAMPTTPTVKYFAYGCTAGGGTAAGAQTYLLTATGSGDLTGLSFTIDHANARGTTVASASQFADKGYAVGTVACWVMKKPALC